MKMVGKTQKGFSAIEALLILVILGSLGGVGYYVYNAKKNSEKSLNSAAQTEITAPKQADKKTYTDVLGFTLNYPNDWKFVAKGTKINGGEYASDEFLPAANYPHNNAYILMFTKEKTDKSAKNYSAEAWANKKELIVSEEDSTINGYQTHIINFKALYAGNGAPGRNVIISHDGVLVDFTYYDIGSEYESIYKTIVDSIKFQ